MSKKLQKVRHRLKTGKVKKKCCRDDPRCSSCPTVVHRLKKMNAIKLDDEALAVAVKKARRW